LLPGNRRKMSRIPAKNPTPPSTKVKIILVCHPSTENNSGYEDEGKLHGQAELVGEVLRFICRGFLRAGLIGFIVRRHIERAA
jgi:hypothetical protein